MYKIVGNEVLLSMSADASCQGLSVRDGSLVMKLTESYSTSAAGCHFPPWFLNNVWRDSTGRRQFFIQDDGVLTYSRPETVHGRRKTRVSAKYECVRQFEGNRNDTSPEAVMLLTRVLDKWYTVLLQKAIRC